MNASKRASTIVTVLAGASLLVLAIVFRDALVAWFSGSDMKDHLSDATTLGDETAEAPHEYPTSTVDALRSAMEAYERIRVALTRGETDGVAAAANTLAEALNVAAAPLDPGSKARFVRANESARRLSEAHELDTARRAFARLSAQFIPLLARHASLIETKHVFECPMFDHALWFQRERAIENPYMGMGMLACGTERKWQATADTANDQIDHFTCSMHPAVHQSGPGKCPICGMDLTPVTVQQQREGVVIIDEARRQLIGVRTAPVVEAPMERQLRVVGRVSYDESAFTDVNLKVGGWITKLHVSQTGMRVARGQPLFTLFSPDLYAAQQDLLLAMRGTRTGVDGSAVRVEQLIRAARKRLSLLGLSEQQIDQIATATEATETIPISSPAAGFVIEKDVVEGAAVQAGMRLFRIAALDKVWIEGDVYAEDLRLVHIGQAATVVLDYVPGRTYAGKVSYVYPYLESAARTGRVRIQLANKDLELRPGMYARINLSSAIGPRLQVPASAVVYTGPRRLVFVDLGDGRFKPQEVRTGIEAQGMFEVLEGLKAGDVVATSGMFLIAAEARISTAAKYWEAAPVPSTEIVPLQPEGAHE